MNRTVRIALFGILVIAQLGVPISMILGSEQILSQGTVYKFRTAPVDPYDAFRGKYVILNFETSRIDFLMNRGFTENDTAYAILEKDLNGFASIIDIFSVPPTSGDYLRVEIDRVYDTTVWLRLPFDRYYMPEDLAPLAERVVRERSRATENEAYVVVRILNGQAKLEELYIGDLTIREFLEEHPE